MRVGEREPLVFRRVTVPASASSPRSECEPVAIRTPKDKAARLAWIDPGWMLLIAGLALIGAALLLPAQAELRRAGIDRDVALALKDWRELRLANYRGFAERLERPDDALLLSLVTTQLNMIPASSEAVPSGSDPEAVMALASPFPQLDPLYQPPVVPTVFESILMKWTADQRGRLLVLATGVLMVFVGVLPPSRPR